MRYVLKFEVTAEKAAGLMAAAQQLDAPPYYVQEGGDTVYDFESDGVDPFAIPISKRPDVKPFRQDAGAVAEPHSPPPHTPEQPRRRDRFLKQRIGSHHAR